MGMDFRVIVEQDHIGGLRRPDSHIYRMAEAGVNGQGNQGYPGKGVFYQLPAPIRGAVVYYNYAILRGRDVLCKKRFQAFFYEFHAIVIRDDHCSFPHAFSFRSCPLFYSAGTFQMQNAA